ITNDMDRRLWEHREGINIKCYTYRRRPVELVYFETFTDVNQAIAFEKQVKGWSRRKKAAIINNEWEKLPELSKNRQTLRQAEPDREVASCYGGIGVVPRKR